MARRWTAMLLVAALAIAGVRADADCLLDDHSCVVTEACPPVCCSGAPPRMSGTVRFCISTTLMSDGTTPNTSAGPDHGSVATEPLTPPSEETEPTDFTEQPPATSTDGSNTPEPSYEPGSPGANTEAPTTTPPQQATDSVDAFQSTTTMTGSRSGGGGVTTVVALVGAVAACVIVVGAIFYKRKNTNKQPLEIPGSSYQGADGSGLTPDNRSLDGMLGRGSTDSMKQLPVLSMASRQDASIVRLSSPFGNGSVRISSPANRGGSNEDFAFAVDTSSRAGSNVNVNFVENDMEIVVEKNGVVAL